MLDMFDGGYASWPVIELAWLGDASTERLLQNCDFAYSYDGITWVRLMVSEWRLNSEYLKVATPHRPVCVTITENREWGRDHRECSIKMLEGTGYSKARYFRAQLREDQVDRWTVYEIWVRGEQGPSLRG